jgi:polar amino acid transport system substrate-binding protein
MRWAAGILAVFIFSGAAGAQERILRLATEGAYPPFNAVTPAGTLEGFDIDIGNALCAEMRFKCEWVVQDWDGMIPALQAAKFDAIVASMFITEERKQQVDFTDRYYSTPPAVIVRKDSEIDGATPADLKGRSVGVQGGSVYAIYAESLLGDSNVKHYVAIPEMTADLTAGRIDAINDDLLVLDQFLKSTEGACCRLAGEIAPILSIHGPGAGIAVRRGDPILAQFNAALERIQAKGVYKSINDRYFSFNISGAPN